mmetsp:Transcript_7730/g.22000  ORF Transcript_7730/g.22000 Transcript_7730/m.22000 type:complete len:382 (+) Transcript_7730:92-1237(+)
MASLRLAVVFAVLAIVANFVRRQRSMAKDLAEWVPEEWKGAPVIPDALPAATALADAGRWAERPAIDEAAVRHFDREGFVVLRQVVDHWALDLLREASDRVCAETLDRQGWCHLKQTRWMVDEFRDFLVHGPLGHITQAFVRRPAVRVLQDGAFTMGYREAEHGGPNSEELHLDDNGLAGVYGDLHRNTSAVTVWMPMHDIDLRLDGGGMEIIPGFLQHECRQVKTGWKHWGTTSSRTDEDCWEELKSMLTLLEPFKKGDVLLFHPWLMHRTQPVLRPGFRRYALFAWFVDAASVVCRPDFCDSTMPGKPCCRDAVMQPNAKLDHPCYPQVHPFTPRHELDAMLEQKPKPLIGRTAVSRDMIPYSCDDSASVVWERVKRMR